MTKEEDLEDAIRVFRKTKMSDWRYQNEVISMIKKMDSDKLQMLTVQMLTDRVGNIFITRDLKDWTDQDHKNMWVATYFCVDILQ